MREEKEGLRRIAKASGTIAKIRRMVTASGHVYLRKGARGGVWYAKFRLPDGSQINERLGKEWTERGRPQAGYLTRRMAEARLRELLADAQRGTLAAQHKTGATFGDACAEWLRYTEHDRGRAPSTVSDYRSAVSHSLLPAFGSERPLEEMTAARIDAYRAQMVGEGKLSNRTINKQLVMLNGIFRRAQRVWGLPTNPAAMVERQPVHRTGDFNVLTPGEVEALARAAASEQDAALFVTAAFSGLRMGELRGLCWGDVDFAKRLIHVPRGFTRWQLGHTKSHKVRSVPMIDQVMRVLDGPSRREYFTADGDLVFANEVGGYIDDGRLRRRFKKALVSAGLKQLRFHDLRHTFGTIAVQASPLTDVKAFMGHADIQTTMIYVHHVPQHDAAERLSRVVARSGDFVDADAGERRVPRSSARRSG